VDKQGGIHLSIGKISFNENQINDNAFKVIEAVNESRPTSVKGKFVRSLSITTSMNPGLRIVC